MSSFDHVAVFAFPFSTHSAPLLAVVRRLAAASPASTFSFFNTSESNRAIIIDDVPTNVRPHDVWDGVPEGHVFTGKHQERIELFMEAAPDTLRRSTAGRDVTCLVTDAFFWFAADVARELGVPWVPFWTAGPTSLSGHLYTDLIRTHYSNATPDQVLSQVPGLSKVIVEDLPEGVVSGNLESLFSQMLHKMGQMLPRAAAVFINSFEELDSTITQDLKSKFTKFLNVGPFNLVTTPPPTLDEHFCLPWLDKHEPVSVAYISFGSVTVPQPKEIVAIAQVLEESCVPFIWSLKDSAKADMPKGFLNRIGNNGLVLPWVPQVEILSHRAVGVFVTHCGWNSLLEGIAGGVPMICRPFFGDQRLNSRMIQDVWEIGTRVESGVFTKEGFEKSLGLILSQERGKRMREKIKALNQMAKEAVGEKGSSTENFKLLQHVITKP